MLIGIGLVVVAMASTGLGLFCTDLMGQKWSCELEDQFASEDEIYNDFFAKERGRD